MNKQAIKVCLVQPVLSPYWIERLKVLAKNENLKLTLFLERDSFVHRPGWQPESIDGVTIRILGSTITKSIRKGDDLGYQVKSIRSIPWRLTGELWHSGADVVVLCNATELVFALPVKWFKNLKIALLVEDTLHATRNLNQLAKFIKKWIYRSADLFFSFSDDANAFLRMNGINGVVARTSWSVNMSLFDRSRNQEAYLTVETTKDRRKIIFVGSFIERKGVIQLLDAWRMLPTNIRLNAELKLVGSGPLQSEIEQYIVNYSLSEVSLLGQKKYNEVIDLLKNSDLFVLPTYEDLFSLTVVEAMACGCPVITTQFNGARELVDEGVNGWIVDPTQPGMLTALLERALSGHVDLNNMGAAARSRVECMDNTIVMEQFSQSLHNLVAGHSI